MTFEECLKKGLIKKDGNAPERVVESLKIAERFLVEARGNLKAGYNEGAELLAYNAAFHCGRALLFSKGFTEKSHACLITALGALYKEDTELREMLITFDQFRLSRHNVQYGGELVDPDTAEAFVGFASKMHALAKKRLG
jgi:uncharacterized protein (UPF0332 family)